MSLGHNPAQLPRFHFTVDDSFPLVNSAGGLEIVATEGSYKHSIIIHLVTEALKFFNI